MSYLKNNLLVLLLLIILNSCFGDKSIDENNCVIKDFDYFLEDSSIFIESYLDTCTNKYVNKGITYRRNGTAARIELYPNTEDGSYYSMFCDSLGRLIYIIKKTDTTYIDEHIFNRKVFEQLQKGPIE